MQQESAQAAALRGVPPTLPAGFVCPGCGYELGGASVKVCSECGRGVEVADLERFHKRLGAGAALRRVKRRMLWQAPLVLAVMCVGAVVLGMNAGAGGAGLAALVLCGIAIVGSVGSGLLAARAAEARDREVVALAWLLTLPWLNAPWLMVPAFAVAGVSAALMGLVSTDAVNAPTMGKVSVVMWVLAGAAWLIGSVGMMMAGTSKLNRVLREFGVRQQGWWWVGLRAAAAVVCLGATLLGLAGMIFATGGAIRLAMAMGY